MSRDLTWPRGQRVMWYHSWVLLIINHSLISLIVTGFVEEELLILTDLMCFYEFLNPCFLHSKILSDVTFFSFFSFSWFCFVSFFFILLVFSTFFLQNMYYSSMCTILTAMLYWACFKLLFIYKVIFICC